MYFRGTQLQGGDLRDDSFGCGGWNTRMPRADESIRNVERPRYQIDNAETQATPPRRIDTYDTVSRLVFSADPLISYAPRQRPAPE